MVRFLSPQDGAEDAMLQQAVHFSNLKLFGLPSLDWRM